jgi:DNA-binding transcriptional LysR family regulator
MIEVRHLKYFVALVNEMHFTKAAQQLHIAQPALSQNIRQIEDELGAKLLVRTHREMSLTPAGRAFYHEACLALQQLERVQTAVRRAVRGEAGSLAIGFTVTTILGNLPQVLSRFKDAYPEVDLTVREHAVDTLVAMLRSGQLDIVCVDSGVVDARLDSKPLPPLPMVVALNGRHRLAADPGPIRLAELADETFILPTPYKEYTLYDMFVRTCRDAGFEPKCKYFADSALGGIGLVAANLAVDLMHELPNIRPHGVVWRRISDPQVPLQMQLVWRRDDVSTPARNLIAMAD